MAREREYIRAARQVFESLGWKHPKIIVVGTKVKEFGYKLRVVSNNMLFRVFTDDDLQDYVNMLFADVELINQKEIFQRKHKTIGMNIDLRLDVLAKAAGSRHLTAAFIEYLTPRLNTEELEGVINARMKSFKRKFEYESFWGNVSDGVCDDLTYEQNDRVYGLCIEAALNVGSPEEMKQNYADVLRNNPKLYLAETFIYPDSIGVRLNIYADKPEKAPLYFIVFELENPDDQD